MTRPCPEHWRWPGTKVGDCRICDHEAETADAAAGIAAVRAQIPQHHTEDTTPRGRAIARARAERKTQP